MPKIGVGKLKKSSRSRSWYRSIIHCGHWFTADKHHSDKQLSRADVTPPTQATTRQVCFTGGHAVNRKQWRCCSSYSWMDLFCRARETMRWKWDDVLCTCRCASVGGRISDAPRPSVRPSASYRCRRFSRNSKAVETSNLVETQRQTREAREANLRSKDRRLTSLEKVVFRAYHRHRCDRFTSN